MSDIVPGIIFGNTTTEITIAQLNEALAGTIKEGAVTNSKIANGAITSNKIANNAIETKHIKSGAITSDLLPQIPSSKLPSNIVYKNSSGSLDTVVLYELASGPLYGCKEASDYPTGGTPERAVFDRYKGRNSRNLQYVSLTMGTQDNGPSWLLPNIAIIGDNADVAFQLSVGTYRIYACAYAFSVGHHQITFNRVDSTYDVPGADLIQGSRGEAPEGVASKDGGGTIAVSPTPSFLIGHVVVTPQNEDFSFRILHRCKQKQVTNGRGKPEKFFDNDTDQHSTQTISQIYAFCEITRIGE